MQVSAGKNALDSLIELTCTCGKVHGTLKVGSPERLNRAVCYCLDCQAYLHELGRADWLDEKGGSDVVQVAPDQLSFDRGNEHIVALRLTPKGLHRWYAGCCKTPLGNTMTPGLPFIGIPARALGLNPTELDAHFGKPRGVAFPQRAVGGPPPGAKGTSIGQVVHILRLMLGWRLGGHTWPHPFFDRASGNARYPIRVLSTAERDALRPLCGPDAKRAPV